VPIARPAQPSQPAPADRPLAAAAQPDPGTLPATGTQRSQAKEIRRQALLATDAGHQVAVVTADRALAANVAPAHVLSPTWLLDRIG